nr:MAG TPA: putative TetR-family transcriptional regulator [Caudoviricetes sp.]
MNREDLKRPKQMDFISNSFLDLDKDGYIAALENYLSDLEKHYKELQDALEAAGIGNGTLYKYALNAERGLRIAIGDAMPDVSEWRRFAEGYGEEELFDR